MWQLFRELTSQGKTMFISTHLMEEATLCDRVAVLRQGEIIADDSPAAILEAGRARPYGLASEVEAVTVEPDTLEDVILAIIQDRGES
jgi:ABC-2 type transport system ATP-binding protein